MTYDVGLELGNCLFGALTVSQIGLEQAHTVRDVFTLAGAQIVQHRNFMPCPQGLFDDMAADESGASRDEYSHLL
jgi:hypothetical protein